MFEGFRVRLVLGAIACFALAFLFLENGVIFLDGAERALMALEQGDTEVLEKAALARSWRFPLAMVGVGVILAAAGTWTFWANLLERFRPRSTMRLPSPRVFVPGNARPRERARRRGLEHSVSYTYTEERLSCPECGRQVVAVNGEPAVCGRCKSVFSDACDGEPAARQELLRQVFDTVRCHPDLVGGSSEDVVVEAADPRHREPAFLPSAEPAVSPAAPVYDPVEATRVAYDALPNRMKNLASRADVGMILDLGLRYQEELGLVGESPADDGGAPTLDTREMARFIESAAAKKLRFFRPEVIEAVLAGEAEYLAQLGVIAAPPS